MPDNSVNEERDKDKQCKVLHKDMLVPKLKTGKMNDKLLPKVLDKEKLVPKVKTVKVKDKLEKMQDKGMDMNKSLVPDQKCQREEAKN